MEKKKIYYIIGAIAIVGIGYYLWNKNKSQQKSEEAETDEEAESGNKDAGNKIAIKRTNIVKKGQLREAVASERSAEPVKKLTPQELESKLQTACGKKPRLKKNKRKYEQCRADYTAKLKSEGLVAFDGTYEGVVSESFYSSFENNWDINF